MDDFTMTSPDVRFALATLWAIEEQLRFQRIPEGPEDFGNGVVHRLLYA